MVSENLPLLMFSNIYSGRRVLVTGHTGFKGTWLTAWLLHLGAEVFGYSLDLPGKPSNFEILGLDKRMGHHLGDVRDKAGLAATLDRVRPEIVFHLAAQPLVRRSYADPIFTFETNAIGTLNILECIRHSPSVRAAVMITSDKCYRNVEWIWGYRENDLLGGDDPYSASKGCAELIAYAYMKSYFNGDPNAAAIATASGRQCCRRRGLGRRPYRARLHSLLVEWRYRQSAQSEIYPALAARDRAAQRIPPTWSRTLGSE